MSKKSQPTIAICYDYDGTLIRGNMQENSFIPEIGMSKNDFWKEVKANAKKHDMDEVLAYMHLMLKKAGDDVYPAKSGKRKNKAESKKEQAVQELQKNNRVQFIAEANYSNNKDMYKIVTSLIDRIVNELELKMNLNAK